MFWAGRGSCDRRLVQPRLLCLTGRRFPVLWQELIDLGVLHPWHPGQHVGQVFLSLDASSSATLKNRIDHRTAPTRIRMANEEPTALTHTTGSDRILNQIIVDLKLRRFQINQKGLVFI